MDSIIPKNIFMVWLGDNIPSYAKLSLDAYKVANPDFNVQLVHYDMQHILSVYNGNISTVLEELLHIAIEKVLKEDKALSVNDKRVFKHFQALRNIQPIRFVQILSDLYRLEIISKFGGIYVDCDTFPLKPFDAALLQKQQFTVTRHYDTIAKYVEKNIGIDNYFFGSVASESLEITTQLLQTANKWWTDIKYLINKTKFYNLELKYIPKYNQPFYIEHYFDGNWKIVNGKIRTQASFLDNSIIL